MRWPSPNGCRSIPKVAWVSYPGLPSDKNHADAEKYSPLGAGAVFTFGLTGGYPAGIRLVELVELFSHLANVGDTKSLIIHPASTTHRQLSDEQKIAAGAGPDVVRLSVGIEDVVAVNVSASSRLRTIGIAQGSSSCRRVGACHHAFEQPAQPLHDQVASLVASSSEA